MATNAEYLAQGHSQQDINLALMGKKLGQNIPATGYDMQGNADSQTPVNAQSLT